MIGLLGLNHKTAPIEIRGRFVFCEEDVRRFIPGLSEMGLTGAIVLSTCNRTEIYFDYSGSNIESFSDYMLSTLINWRKADTQVKQHFYTYYGENVSRHLFRVAAGLDSMALGEYQIVGQLKEAFAISERQNINSSVLIRLFNKAFEAGKSVRTNTELSKGAVSISYAAVELAAQKLRNLTSHPALLIGAGQTGELTMQNMVKKGCTKFTVVNRTFEKAAELAERYNGEARNLDELDDLLLNHDIVIASTASKKALITKEKMMQIMPLRHYKPMFFIDLSVPANVEATVGEIDNTFVYNVDDLTAVVDETFEKRKGEIDKAEEIIESFVAEFADWQHTRELTATFQSISENFQKINQQELEGFMKKQVKNNGEDAEMYAEHITNKFIRLMIRNVKSVTDNGRKKEYIDLVNDLFKIAQ
ncbi:glutamyl-tRNA reductase [Maribellus sp. CM-23]|uniref:glutamyl-tRNA reductase n=1 Tax=Maribellus sp. CM-23 TaxID=2781026 RepID=UPI001EFF92BA|nr:glutamyl-tRNA reductase [Maribellus sp. CM-23]MCE4565636.1 glutamyl-tRNA reductase [Maribellus sp. CM-23]